MPLLSPGYAVLPNRAVRFVLDRPAARSVLLAGSFTGWGSNPLQARRDPATGFWVVETGPLPEGVHFYKYVVDGQWLPDPSHPMGEPDGFGGRNSALGINGQSLGATGGVRVACLNLHTYQEHDPLLKLEQIAFGLSSLRADVVALQEVAEHLHDPSRPNAGEILRRRLQEWTGRPWYHEWRFAHVHFEVYRAGVSLLAASPLEQVHEYRLSQGTMPRNAVTALTTVRGVTLRVCSTHLWWPPAGGYSESERLLEALASVNGPAVMTIVAGDFNAEPHEAQVRLVLKAGYADVCQAGGADGNTYGNPPQQRIDYQFARPHPGHAPPAFGPCFRIFHGNTEGNVYQPRVSDHVGLFCVYNWGK